MFLFIIVGIMLVATFLFISSLSTASYADAMTDIQAPDNSSGKAIPRLYGKAYLYGNNIYYGGLSSIAIQVDDGGK